MVAILVLNPNSTDAMTRSLQSEVESLNLPSSYQIDYYTGPVAKSPPSINNQEDADCSTKACIEDFDNRCPHIYKVYDGYLIACYSDHPLVNELQTKITRSGVVVMGIFQASMLYAMNFASQNNKAAILTSGHDWEPLLDRAITKFCANDRGSFPATKFIPTLAAGIPVLDLHKPENYPHLKDCIQQLVENDVGIILLGCAGLSSLSKRMKSEYPHLKFVDSVKVGARLLISYIEVGDI
ncbi:hypothetical protein PICMEDRAFT_34341 [Pichia membranifaciens NRRL Y-2026]|uniref:Asp/Glu/hydantoin racemase n=1 Tax=Pichia membranifaciens NRRL Y-2026 TaxID=763406 RepID=A0A1E3NIH3_9ASCO|nr:hypothetical protein PICMEDRAFT_34341 [Pichia membranifaciens NRRL Y-2026]ODQ45914.1 hypothetical protein PICMEDRAFT_34341 [Pichia membranifaciens NRRL Y-2026]